MIPPENPPPYSEELQEGHITLMRGTTASKERDDNNPMDLSLLTASEVTTWSTSLVTAGDVSIMSTSSADPAANPNFVVPAANPNFVIPAAEDLSVYEELQHRRGSHVDGTDDIAFSDSKEQENASGLDASNPADPPEPSEMLNMEVDSDVLRQPVAIPTSSIHFYRPLHRSLSVGNSNLLLDKHLRVPNPRASSMQTMTLPEPLTTPFPPKVTLPPITRAPRNISPVLREGCVPKEPFGRRPARLPPLHRKRNRVSSWHGENFIVPPSVSAINTVHE